MLRVRKYSEERSRENYRPSVSYYRPSTKNLPTTPDNTELEQPRRRRQQKPPKFAYLTMKNSIFARFARAFFIF